MMNDLPGPPMVVIRGSVMVAKSESPLEIPVPRMRTYGLGFWVVCVEGSQGGDVSRCGIIAGYLFTRAEHLKASAEISILQASLSHFQCEPILVVCSREPEDKDPEYPKTRRRALQGSGLALLQSVCECLALPRDLEHIHSRCPG